MPTTLNEGEHYSPQLAETDAAVRGFVALCVGSVLLLAAPIVLLLAVSIWDAACRLPHVVLLHAWFARIGVVIVAILCAAALYFGVSAVKRASVRVQWMGLAIGGLVMSIVASLVWLITAIALLNTTESMLGLYGK